MNENQVTCDDAVLEAMLRRDQSLEPSEELLAHIESCACCQSRISELAGSTAMWQAVKAAISEAADSDQQRRFPSATLDPSAIHWTESMAKQLLIPPTHPEMLGRLGRYEVERLIGSGGMGVVFKAFDTELNRPVAIKLLAPYLASSGPARKRFAREARAAAAVVHQHVVPIHNVETERELPFIVMQYVSGESLQARIDREGPLELCEILRIGMQVADGLSAAHQQGLVHRDIKPSNILLEEDVDRALISDFGLARAADDASLTRTGFHPGTPQYMSPEQASGQRVDARSDLFSLGSMLYTICTGRPPFRAENSLSVLRRITDSEATPIREVTPSIPEWFERLVNMLMAKRADDRLQSAALVASLLQQCLAHIEQPHSVSLPSELHHLQVTSPQRLIRNIFMLVSASTIAAVMAWAGLGSLIHDPVQLGSLAPSSQTSQTENAAAPAKETPLDNNAKALDKHLILQALAAKGSTITQADVNAEIARVATKFGLTPKMYLEVVEQERGITSAQYSNEVVWPMLALRALVADKIEVSQAEVDKILLSEYGPKVQVRMIAVSRADEAHQLHTKAQANPGQFGRLATEYSEDAASARVEGLLPPIRRTSPDDQLENIAFQLKPQEVSPIFKVGSLHIFLQCVRHLPPTPPNPQRLPAIQQRIADQLRDQRLRKAAEAVFAKLQQKVAE